MGNIWTPEKRERAFWSDVQKGDGCWEWQGTRGHNGYGRTCIATHRIAAHRAAFVYAVGPIPDGLFVLHHCDNPGCCRPDHLFLGTKADNARDMKAKGRSLTGERNTNARLTWANIPAIREARANGVPLKALAAQYGVTMATISYAARGDTWNAHG